MEEVVNALKLRARALHRDAQRGDAKSLERLRRLRELRGVGESDLQKAVLRRHCLSVLARELGLRGWPHAVTVLSNPEADDFGSLLHTSACFAHWNIWCASYEEARAIREEHGGYLLCYKHQFFVVDEHYIRTLGMDPADEDWARMGRDWARPRDPAARQRLCGLAVRARLSA